jgi:hypothetical protein
MGGSQASDSFFAHHKRIAPVGLPSRPFSALLALARTTYDADRVIPGLAIPKERDALLQALALGETPTFGNAPPVNLDGPLGRRLQDLAPNSSDA